MGKITNLDEMQAAQGLLNNQIQNFNGGDQPKDGVPTNGQFQSPFASRPSTEQDAVISEGTQNLETVSENVPVGTAFKINPVVGIVAAGVKVGTGIAASQRKRADIQRAAAAARKRAQRGDPRVAANLRTGLRRSAAATQRARQATIGGRPGEVELAQARIEREAAGREADMQTQAGGLQSSFRRRERDLAEGLEGQARDVSSEMITRAGGDVAQGIMSFAQAREAEAAKETAATQRTEDIKREGEAAETLAKAKLTAADKLATSRKDVADIQAKKATDVATIKADATQPKRTVKAVQDKDGNAVLTMFDVDGNEVAELGKVPEDPTKTFRVTDPLTGRTLEFIPTGETTEGGFQKLNSRVLTDFGVKEKTATPPSPETKRKNFINEREKVADALKKEIRPTRFQLETAPETIYGNSARAGKAMRDIRDQAAIMIRDFPDRDIDPNQLMKDLAIKIGLDLVRLRSAALGESAE